MEYYGHRNKDELSIERGLKIERNSKACLSRESTTSLMKRFYFHLLKSNGTYKS